MLPSQIFKIAVTPDGNTVAALGNVEHDPVWLLDVATGGSRAFQVQGVAGHYGIYSLAFSPNGKRLAWSTWYQAGTLNVERGFIAQESKHEGEVASAAFDKDGKRLFTAGGQRPGQNQFQVWDVTPGKAPRNLAKPLFELEKSGGKEFNLPASELVAAWAPDGSRFAACGRDDTAKLHFWDADGKREKTADGKPRVKDIGNLHAHLLQFVGPDRLLVAGAGWPASPNFFEEWVHLINVETLKIERTNHWPLPAQNELETAASPDGKYLAVTGRPGFQVRLYDLVANKRLRNVGQAYPVPEELAWGPDSRSIAWNFGKDDKGKPVHPGGLNLATLERLGADEVKKFKRNSAGGQGWKLEFEDKDQRKRKDRGLTLDRGKELFELDFDSPPQDWTFYKDGQGKLHVAVLGKWLGGSVVTVNLETGELTHVAWYTHGHDVSVSPDGRYLLLAREDQALSLYRVEGKPALLLRVLVAGPDWVAWTPAGFYAASPGGEKLVGWSVKKDNFTPLAFYPLERFRKTFYRPEAIKLVLEKGSVGEALKAALPPKARDVEIAQVLPPAVKVKEVKKIKEGEKAKIQITAEATPGSKTQPVEELRLLLDGRLHPAVAPKKIKAGQAAEATWLIDELPGRHELKVLARCPDVSGASEPVAVQAALPDDNRPVLYRLCVGVNDYDQKGLTLGSARQDAEAVFAALAKDCAGKDNRFREARGKPLLDKAATRQAVLDALQESRTQGAKPGDLVVVFFAGHGVVQTTPEGSEFYLLTREADPAKPLKGHSLSGEDLRQAFGELPCSVLLLLDACHSAAGVKAFKPATDDLTRSLTDDQVAVTVLAAAMGYETAGEQKEHGLFTQALLAGLKAGAGVPFDAHDHQMYVHHLYSHVFSEVRRASEGKQNPFLNMPWTVPPLALREVHDKAPGPK
jgi:WD40 repeat protein